MEKVAENGRKVKAIVLPFCCFLPLFQKLKNRLKMDEKYYLRLYSCCFLPVFQKFKYRLKMDEK
jgi:hypothetical protein